MLSYVVPTHNRSLFLRRLLGFYAEVGCARPILIADSSDSAEASANRQAVASFEDRLNLHYNHYKLGVIAKCRTAVENVSTPHVVFSADDDFQIPNGVDKCSEFLSENADYATCGGTALFAHADQSKPATLRTYESVAAADPLRRLSQISLGRYFCLFYAVHRTDQCLQRIQAAESYTNYDSSRILPEVLLLQLIAFHGKVKLLDDIVYVRQGHEDSDSARLPNVQDPNAFDDDFQSYQSPLSDQILNHAPLSSAQSYELIKQSLVDLVPGCADFLFSDGRHGPKWMKKLKTALRRLRVFRGRSPGHKRRVSQGEMESLGAEITLALQLIQRKCDEKTGVSASDAA